MEAETGLFGQSFRVHSYKQVRIGEDAADQRFNLSWSQRTEMDRIERLYAGAVWPATPLETRWRHSGWLPDRQRVFAALEAAGCKTARLLRFACCGSGARVEVDRSTGEARVRSSNCGDRFCNPCMGGRSWRVRQRLDELATGKPMQFWTFTVLNLDVPLRDRLQHLLDSFSRLRRQHVFADNVTGGVGVVETKRGEDSGFWHPHIHCLVETDYADWAEIRQGWSKATEDSNGFQAEKPRTRDGVGFYVTKYVSKGFDKTVLRCHDDLRECVVTLKGRRLLIPFGGWYGRTKAAPVGSERRWESVGSLDEVRRRARDGSAVHLGHVASLMDRHRRRLDHMDAAADVPAEI